MVPPRQKPTTATLPPCLATSIAAGDVAQHLLAVDLAGDRHIALSRLGVVADLEFGLGMLKNRRSHREVALAREPVCDGPDMRVDAEDLLNHDDAAARLPRGIGAPGSNQSRAFWLQFNPGHVDFSRLTRRLTLSAARASLRNGDAADN